MRKASNATMVKRLQRELKIAKVNLARSNAARDIFSKMADELKSECEEWKQRFDKLLSREDKP